MVRAESKTRNCIFALAGVFAAGTAGFMWSEGLSAIDAAYFAVVTMSTVGYGDISPATEAGKFVSVLFILFGVGAFMALIASATEGLLSRRDRGVRTCKCHMLTALFFSEIGDHTLELMRQFASGMGRLPDELVGKDTWTRQELLAVSEWLGDETLTIDARTADLAEVRTFLDAKTSLLVRLLENPALLEEEVLSELLRAIFHLRDELAHRKSLTGLPEADYDHLSADMGRVYALLLPAWATHVEYLRQHYPYLFSLAVRANPFEARETASLHQA